MIKLEIDVVNNHNLPQDEVAKELLLLETKMNGWSRYLRFHIQEVHVPDQAERNEIFLKEKLEGNHEHK